MIPWLFRGLLFLESLCGEFRSNILVVEQKQSKSRKNRAREGRKEREKKRIPDQSSVEIIKGVYPEFKCKSILTLSPIYNHDLQGCHFSDVMIATASPVITASYPSCPLKIRSEQNITR